LFSLSRQDRPGRVAGLDFPPPAPNRPRSLQPCTAVAIFSIISSDYRMLFEIPRAIAALHCNAPALERVCRTGDRAGRRTVASWGVLDFPSSLPTNQHTEFIIHILKKYKYAIFAKIDFHDDSNPAWTITSCIRYLFPKGETLRSPKASKTFIFAKTSTIFLRTRR